MKSRTAALLVAIAVAATPVSAQTPTQDGFKFVGIISGAPILPGGIVGGPYLGAFDTSPGNYGTPFDIWCVDYDHSVHIGDTYDVWLTPMDQGDFSHTRLGAGGSASPDDYRWAAYLAGQMDWWTNAADKPADAAVQDALWALLGYGSNINTRLTNFVTNYGVQFGVGNDFWDTAPVLADYNGWSIITCDPSANRYCGYQEFIYYAGTPGTPNEVVPEPASMTLLGTGLVGLLAARRKRRRATAA